MVKNLILRSIRKYQATGGSKKHFNIECNFEPSCSEYTYQAIAKYGVLKGCSLGLKRIKRCNDPDCIHKISDPLI
ncbi:membrane protein insertion efficiency factor YidD [Paraneptunicella aestuarii]|uniref:membrane protein insertion efficiency factor YidD n=1 Tax=Paraneptunicella aestuarii TaxID=2831148 RepID=UPI001E434724|nr:membrane protein insertion efficiency factor YidD [Paraneptunicella aestuarii]UAA37649.1 membrane protein insertion efficiency factor YidD [Paraneptunicella aestuarii]